jgi:hypothetical protein
MAPLPDRPLLRPEPDPERHTIGTRIKSGNQVARALASG